MRPEFSNVYANTSRSSDVIHIKSAYVKAGLSCLVIGALHGLAWSCVVLRALAWSCVVLRGFAWSCVALRSLGSVVWPYVAVCLASSLICNAAYSYADFLVL